MSIRKSTHNYFNIKSIEAEENNKFKTGDKVSIIESKPFSKNKKCQVMENTK